MTNRLYKNDSYLTEFETKISRTLMENDRQVVILAETAFYPESGGQPPDTGLIGSSKVVDVLESDEEILHFVDSAPFQKNQVVDCNIDWSRRFDHMQQHTGQHILSQAFLKSISAETVSFHLGAVSSTIDLSVSSLTRDEIYKTEDLANQIIFENRKVLPRQIEAKDQDQLPIRKKSKRTGLIRVVEIENFDYSPCGGTHCSRTGEVGIIKIRRWERIKKKARVEFFCGKRALLDYRWKNRSLYEASRIFSISDSDVVEAIRRNQDTQKQLLKQLEKQNHQLLELEAIELVSEAQEVAGKTIISKVFEQQDLKALNKLATMILARGGQFVLLAARKERPCILFARDPGNDPLDMNQLVQECAPLINGRGGGNRERAQILGTDGTQLEKILDRTIKLITA